MLTPRLAEIMVDADVAALEIEGRHYVDQVAELIPDVRATPHRRRRDARLEHRRAGRALRPDDDARRCSGVRDVDLRDRAATGRVSQRPRLTLVIHAAALRRRHRRQDCEAAAVPAGQPADRRRVCSRRRSSAGVPRYALHRPAPRRTRPTAPSPIVESALLTGAARAGQRGLRRSRRSPASRLCDYASAADRARATGRSLPSNLYGPSDHFDPAGRHLIAADARARSTARGRAGARRSRCGATAPRDASSPTRRTSRGGSSARSAGLARLAGAHERRRAATDHTIREYYETRARTSSGFDGDASSSTPRSRAACRDA